MSAISLGIAQELTITIVDRVGSGMILPSTITPAQSESVPGKSSEWQGTRVGLTNLFTKSPNIVEIAAYTKTLISSLVKTFAILIMF